MSRPAAVIPVTTSPAIRALARLLVHEYARQNAASAPAAVPRRSGPPASKGAR